MRLMPSERNMSLGAGDETPPPQAEVPAPVPEISSGGGPRQKKQRGAVTGSRQPPVSVGGSKARFRATNRLGCSNPRHCLATMSMQLLSARWVVTVEPSGRVLENHTVVVDDGKIVDVLPTDEAKIKYGSVPDSQRWEGKESVLLPGFVNCHTHSAMTLLRGIADDLSLMPWLHEHIWPAEGALVSPDFVYDGTKLAMAEMLRSGTTCFNDMYFFPDAVPPQTPR